MRSGAFIVMRTMFLMPCPYGQCGLGGLNDLNYACAFSSCSLNLSTTRPRIGERF